MKLIKTPNVPPSSSWDGDLECIFLSLNKKQRKYVDNLVRRNRDVMKRKTVLHVSNNRLGIVKLLHLLNHIGENRLLEAHPLHATLVFEYPRQYFRLAKQRKIGWKQRKALSKEPGV
jgi:hypothetical protein